jgi:hypothetical protein
MDIESYWVDQAFTKAKAAGIRELDHNPGVLTPGRENLYGGAVYLLLDRLVAFGRHVSIVSMMIHPLELSHPRKILA